MYIPVHTSTYQYILVCTSMYWYVPCLYFHLPPWENPHEKVPQWPVPGRLVLVSLAEGELHAAQCSPLSFGLVNSRMRRRRFSQLTAQASGLFRRGHRHWMWLCVSEGWPQRAQAAEPEGTTPHLCSTALQGNAPAIDWSTCFFAGEICIFPSTLPSVLRP